MNKLIYIPVTIFMISFNVFAINCEDIKSNLKALCHDYNRTITDKSDVDEVINSSKYYQCHDFDGLSAQKSSIYEFHFTALGGLILNTGVSQEEIFELTDENVLKSQNYSLKIKPNRDLVVYNSKENTFKICKDKYSKNNVENIENLAFDAIYNQQGSLINLVMNQGIGQCNLSLQKEKVNGQIINRDETSSTVYVKKESFINYRYSLVGSLSHFNTKVTIEHKVWSEIYNKVKAEGEEVLRLENIMLEQDIAISQDSEQLNSIEAKIGDELIRYIKAGECFDIP